MTCEEHCCPFLNADDVRCNQNFRVDRMQYAYKHCFGDYLACPIAAQLLGLTQEPDPALADDADDPDLAVHLPVLASFQRAFSNH